MKSKTYFHTKIKSLITEKTVNHDISLTSMQTYVNN